MEGKSSYFILLVIVAFLSISLAFLAIGYFFFDSHGSAPEKEIVMVTEKIPTDDELANKVIFEKTNFNLKKTNDKQVAVIVLSACMKHYKKVDGIKSEEEIAAKIDFYNKEINSAIGTYFQGLTLEDVSQADAKQKASEDLKKIINDILINNDKKASPLVYSIVFDYWFYQ
ncbi:flagellar basal body-associated FliL family protein [Ruminiclostridium cellobioparum]|uniref:Flagellar protein FliL n=1 Tax=Ruminiclostridium cellobioparum subsp. termitidis CT1112 TaxID=1195236 RepID=S0FMJ3_RUMCE|nr:flagellar basal body-associated FliL family protein [Ruminiclostridium cellobioparum]EMS71561.1 Flagellar basal body-associated protein FliL [Ruminiclostridium cellobioparum subsp. termitidis CT1112]